MLKASDQKFQCNMDLNYWGWKTNNGNVGEKILQWKKPKLPKSIFKIVMGLSTVAQESAEFIPWQEERVGCLWRHKTKFQNKESNNFRHLGWEKTIDASPLCGNWFEYVLGSLGFPFLLLVLFRYLPPWLPALAMSCGKKKTSSQGASLHFCCLL